MIVIRRAGICGLVKLSVKDLLNLAKRRREGQGPLSPSSHE
jgi:hypothetical protein